MEGAEVLEGCPYRIRKATDAILRNDSRGSDLERMPARSKKQLMAAGAALAAKRGEGKKSSLKGASRKMVESMSERELRDFAKTKRKKLPTKKSSKS